MTWLKKSWHWLIAVIVFAVAVIVWWVTRNRSGWAAEKLLEIQGDTEQRVAKIEDQKAQAISKLDKAWGQKRRKLVEEEQRQIAKARRDAATLNEAALKRKLLGDLDDPL